jgi:hypothetical protein
MFLLQFTTRLPQAMYIASSLRGPYRVTCIVLSSHRNLIASCVHATAALVPTMAAVARRLKLQ